MMITRSVPSPLLVSVSPLHSLQVKEEEEEEEEEMREESDFSKAVRALKSDENGSKKRKREYKVDTFYHGFSVSERRMSTLPILKEGGKREREEERHRDGWTNRERGRQRD